MIHVLLVFRQMASVFSSVLILVVILKVGSLFEELPKVIPPARAHMHNYTFC